MRFCQERPIQFAMPVKERISGKLTLLRGVHVSLENLGAREGKAKTDTSDSVANLLKNLKEDAD